MIASKFQMRSVTSKIQGPALRTCPRSPLAQGQTRSVAARAFDDTNFALNLFASTLCLSIPAAVTTITSAEKEKDIERLQTLDGALPLIAALGADAIVHSIPGINLLTGLVTEPLGAAAGVAYIMTVSSVPQHGHPCTRAAVEPARCSHMAHAHERVCKHWGMQLNIKTMLNTSMAPDHAMKVMLQGPYHT